MQTAQNSGNDFSSLAANTIGIVLCGGESKRMGTDKGLLTINRNQENFFWFLDRKILLEKFFPQTFVSLRHEQWVNYESYIKKTEIIFDKESDKESDEKNTIRGDNKNERKNKEDGNAKKSRGPLHAIVSAYEKFPHKHLFVLACDMILFEDIMLEKILQEAQRSQKSVACFFQNNIQETGGKKYLEPLGTFLRAEKVAQIANEYTKQAKKKHASLRYYYQEDFSWLQLSKEEKKYFINCNRREDIPKKIM